jgi:hypothetical protein
MGPSSQARQQMSEHGMETPETPIKKKKKEKLQIFLSSSGSGTGSTQPRE